MKDQTSQAIIDTVAYFDMFEYPLTLSELHAHLYAPSSDADSFSEMLDLIETDHRLTSRLFFKDGLIGIAGHERYIETRHERYVISVKKYRLVHRFVSMAKHIPFVSCIAVCNNLSFFNAKQESDLDLFILCDTKMLPFVRFVTVLLSVIFFKRPGDGRHEDTICLSFFADTAHADLSRYAYDTEDIYLIFWVATMQPVFSSHRETVYAFENQNRRLLQHMPNHRMRLSIPLTRYGFGFLRQTISTLVRLLPITRINDMLYTAQLRRLPERIASVMNTSTAVIVTPSIFKTHINDIRRDIYEQWVSAKSR